MLLDTSNDVEMQGPPRTTTKQAIIQQGRLVNGVRFRTEMSGQDLEDVIRRAMRHTQLPLNGRLTIHSSEPSGWRFQRAEPLVSIDGEDLRTRLSQASQICYISHRESAETATPSARANQEGTGRSSVFDFEDNEMADEEVEMIDVEEIPDPGSPGRNASVASPGRDSLASRGRDSLASRGRDSLASPGRDSLPSPGRDSLPSPGRDSLPSPGRDSLPSPGRDSLPSPGRDSFTLSIPGRNHLASADDVLVTTTPRANVDMEVGSLRTNEDFTELVAGTYDPFAGHFYQTMRVVANLPATSLSSVYNTPILTTEFRVAQAQAVADTRILLVALAVPSAGSAIISLMLDPEFQQRVRNTAYLWVAEPRSSQGNSARTELDLAGYGADNILAVCIPGQTSRLRRLGVFEERLLTTRAFSDMMDLAEEALTGVRQEREQLRQWRALRQAQDEEFRQAEEQGATDRVREVEHAERGSTPEEKQIADSLIPQNQETEYETWLTPAEHIQARWGSSALRQVQAEEQGATDRVREVEHAERGSTPEEKQIADSLIPQNQETEYETWLTPAEHTRAWWASSALRQVAVSYESEDEDEPDEK
ncbi:uncharacterized protein LOC118405266 isoform X2 [Branchiostoma floridae]|uniref:Uncharacterized protein LOC118405266 isoform X2 n=1 Tax=Branchiostoma floridae TaxID=7739 RepID=A0A9J7KFK7_BRAFL|nr:uncharacterized protein LOC118405266 isoform X2 [Branchiostoma floridae]